eukprot:1195312-Prorocentrum_minimum.AAC.3
MSRPSPLRIGEQSLENNITRPCTTVPYVYIVMLFQKARRHNYLFVSCYNHREDDIDDNCSFRTKHCRPARSTFYNESSLRIS